MPGFDPVASSPVGSVSSIAGPYYRSHGNVVAGTVGGMASSASPGVPTVLGLNGVLVLTCVNWDNSTMSVATAGWTLLTQMSVGSGGVGGSSFTMGVWIAPETASAPTVTWTNNSPYKAMIGYYAADDGPTGLTPAASHSSGATTGVMSDAGFTTTAANALSVYSAGIRGNGPISSMGGYTNNFDASGIANNDIQIGSAPFPLSGTATGPIANSDTPAAWVITSFQLITVPPGDLRVSDQSAYVPMTQPGLVVPEQSAYVPMTQPGLVVSEQSAYVALLKSTGRRRQLMINSI